MIDYSVQPHVSTKWDSIIDMIDDPKCNFSSILMYHITSIIFDINTFHHLILTFSGSKNIETFIYYYLKRSSVLITMELVDIILQHVKLLNKCLTTNIDIEVFEYIIANNHISDDTFVKRYHTKSEHIDIFYKYDHINALLIALGHVLYTMPINYELITKILGMVNFDQYLSYLYKYDNRSINILAMIDEVNINIFLRIISILPHTKSSSTLCNKIVDTLHVSDEILQCLICHIIIIDSHKNIDDDD